MKDVKHVGRVAGSRSSDQASDCLEVVRNCLFCGSDECQIEVEEVEDIYFRADPGMFSFQRCNDCNSLWLETQPSGQRLLDAYTKYYTRGATSKATKGNPIKSGLRDAYLSSKFGGSSATLSNTASAVMKVFGRDHLGLEHHYRFAPRAPARILDYGCGNGDYLRRLYPFGYDLTGVEYDPHLIQDLASRNINVADIRTIDYQGWAQSFDHISISHVIEHVPDPLIVLQRLYDWLRPGKTLFIEVPNADATGLKLFGRCWRGLEAPRHFALPSRNGLVNALCKIGFSRPQQYISRTVRQSIWDLSFDKCPAEDKSQLKSAMIAAPAETEENTEFLTFVARKPFTQ